MIFEILQYFGIAPDKLTPIVLVLGIGGFILLKYWLKPIEKEIKEINKDLTNVNNATCEIQSHFSTSGFRILHSLTMKPGSPFILTDYGKKLVNESGFIEMFEQNKEEIVNAVKARKPKTNYDIQEYSKDVLLQDFIDSKIMDTVKNYAFQNAVNIKIILEAAGLIVRDEVMTDLKFDDNSLHSNDKTEN